MTSAIILDTETTDTENCEVIEFACINYANPQDSFRQLYKPARPIKFGVLAVHHLIPEMLEGCPPASEAPGDVPAANYWIGHNIDFDWRALGSPPGVKRICTLAMSRNLWPELDSHTLGAVMYYTQGVNATTRAKVTQAHSALDDALMCNDVLKTILILIKTTDLQKLWEFSENARIPTIMAFGKHKGKRIAEVDRGYSNWYRRQPEPDPYLLEAFRRAGI